MTTIGNILFIPLFWFLPVTICSQNRMFDVPIDCSYCFNLDCTKSSHCTIYTLEIQNDAVFVFPNELKSLDSLKRLGLIGGNQFEFNGQILKLKNLEELCLGGNHIRRLPKRIDSLQNLRKLNVCCNEISSLPKRFKFLDRLEFLSLSANEFLHIPNEIYHLKNLKFLDLSKNKIAKQEIDLFRTKRPDVQIVFEEID